jgi:hypothetical protein
MIWMFLCGSNQQYCSEKRRETSVTGSGCVKQEVSGVGYSPQPEGFGIMFGKGLSPNNPTPYSKMTQVNRAERIADEFNDSIFTFLITLLPSPDESSNFDVDPPSAVLSMLLNSKVLSKAAELLRNHSLDNAAKRKNLYNALLGLLRTIGAHEAMSNKAISSERLVKSNDINLVTLSFRGVPKGLREETATLLADHLRNLNIKSNMMLQGALNNRNEFGSEEGRDMLWPCRKISDLASFLFGEDHLTATATDCGIIDAPDNAIFATYGYTRDAQSLRHSRPGHIKRLTTEITTLKTSLSTGIYVKFASTRLDVMK